ncbi:DUF262 domain-containing protein [Paraburkholderia sp. Ac-20347]|uniref:DUF262 domain-containing protein n=1 Tax=Paraburkholderia sp. Ac-20347 TaxID=2703892 RepID=UPI001981E18F|nr:DUF262 domain-containing protein [Paraburkholderia sp. Ac-20347]MBN3812430.1 DUF262 domain-containing protein [Paraburkholderia sp. Ac-20347]
MIESLTALASENSNPSLRSLLEDVLRGHIRVPRFQRPFIWTDEQRLELLASVRDGMPIGSLLVWRTTKFELATFPNVGAHRIPALVGNPSLGRQYLLDGHQRVSTLLGLLLRGPEEDIIHDAEEDIDWAVEYDLDSEEFVFRSRRIRARRNAPLLPLWTLFDGRLVNKHMRMMRKQFEPTSEDSFDRWEARADQLSYQFQQFRVPIVAMVTDDLNLAAKAFQRINSLGTPMSEAHLVAALSWRPEFDLRERIEDIRESLSPEWRTIEDNIFLQVCKGLCGLDLTRPGQAELVKAIETNNELLPLASIGLQGAISLLDQAGVTHAELLPYSYQLTLIAVALANRAPLSDRSRRAIIKWFWRTSWAETFATSSFRQVRAQQQSLIAAIEGSEDVVAQWEFPERLPHRFDFRSARSRLLMIRMAMHLGDEGRWLLSTNGRAAMVRLIRPPSDASANLKKLCQGPGNRFLIEPLNAEMLHHYLWYDGEEDDFLQRHFVDADMAFAYRRGDWELFLQLRSEAIAQWDLSEWMAIAGSGSLPDLGLSQRVEVPQFYDLGPRRFKLRIVGPQRQPVFGADVCLLDSRGFTVETKSDENGSLSIGFDETETYHLLIAGSGSEGFCHYGQIPENGGDLQLEPLKQGGSIISKGKIQIPWLGGTFALEGFEGDQFLLDMNDLARIDYAGGRSVRLNESFELIDSRGGRATFRVRFFNGWLSLVDYTISGTSAPMLNGL